MIGSILGCEDVQEILDLAGAVSHGEGGDGELSAGSLVEDSRRGSDRSVNVGGKVQRGAGEMGDTRYSRYLPGGSLSTACVVTLPAAAASPPVARLRRLASFSR
jgi:hypothetical protein